jgi:hypothetical protein
MNGESRPVSDPGYGAESVGPGPEVGDFPEKFQGMAFFLQRIRFRRGLPDKPQPFRRHLHGLPGSGGGDQPALYFHRGPSTDLAEGGFGFTAYGAPVKGTLDAGKGRSIVYFHKNKIF